MDGRNCGSSWERRVVCGSQLLLQPKDLEQEHRKRQRAARDAVVIRRDLAVRLAVNGLLGLQLGRRCPPGFLERGP
jgi:hypothetical protein